jgi:hypothetical protein
MWEELTHMRSASGKREGNGQGFVINGKERTKIYEEEG